jgi:hypothetical protein
VWLAFVLGLALAASLAFVPAGRAAPSQRSGHPAQSSSHGQGKSQGLSGDLSDRGIVQSVSPSAIVVKELNGSSVTIAVGSKTVVFVGGAKATLADIAPGFVATVYHAAGSPADEVDATVVTPAAGGSATVVRSAGGGLVVVTTASGAVVKLQVGAQTQVFVNGKRASLRDVKPGFVLVSELGAAQGSGHGNSSTPPAELRFVSD